MSKVQPSKTVSAPSPSAAAPQQAVPQACAAGDKFVDTYAPQLRAALPASACDKFMDTFAPQVRPFQAALAAGPAAARPVPAAHDADDLGGELTSSGSIIYCKMTGRYLSTYRNPSTNAEHHLVSNFQPSVVLPHALFDRVRANDLNNAKLFDNYELAYAEFVRPLSKL